MFYWQGPISDQQNAVELLHLTIFRYLTAVLTPSDGCSSLNMWQKNKWGDEHLALPVQTTPSILNQNISLSGDNDNFETSSKIDKYYCQLFQLVWRKPKIIYSYSNLLS